MTFRYFDNVCSNSADLKFCKTSISPWNFHLNEKMKNFFSDFYRFFSDFLHSHLYILQRGKSESNSEKVYLICFINTRLLSISSICSITANSRDESEPDSSTRWRRNRSSSSSSKRRKKIISTYIYRCSLVTQWIEWDVGLCSLGHCCSPKNFQVWLTAADFKFHEFTVANK